MGLYGEYSKYTRCIIGVHCTVYIGTVNIISALLVIKICPWWVAFNQTSNDNYISDN